MSSQTSQTSPAAPDPDLLDQTRQQIRGLVSEIESLSRSDVPPPEFYEGFLNRLVQALAAEGGAVWVLGEGGRLELAYQVNLRLTRLADRREDQEKHGRLLRKIITSGEGTLAAPHSGEGDDQTGNPTDYLLVLGPLRSDQEVQGIVEVFQRPNPRPAVERGYLRFVQQMCELAGDYLKTHSLRLFTDRQVMWTQLEQFTRMVHQGLDPRATAYTIANEGRRLIECDRVTVAIKHGRKSRVEAISGQETFDRRSNTVALLDKLASVVVAGGEPVWYSGDTSNMAPQIEEALEAYVDESHTKAMAILPLAKPRDTASDSIDHPQPAEHIGALIIEQITDEAFTQGMTRRIEVVRDHCSAAMSNAIEHQSLFLMPVWRTIGKTRAVVATRNLPKTVTIVGVLVAIVAAMFLVPADFKLHGRGTLEPVVKRNIFAGVEGKVVYIAPNAEQEQMVEAGEELLRLENPELNVQIQNFLGQFNAAGENIVSLGAQKDQLRNSPPQDRAQYYVQMAKIDGDIAKEQTSRTSLREQLRILDEKQKRLIVRSPMKGQVLTWQVREKLENRPVEKGQVLLTVADPSQDWDLEIKMPEDRMGHIMDVINEQGTHALDVEYIVMTDPGVTRWGKIKEIQNIAEVQGEEGNVVLIRVKIDKNDLVTAPRQGATVTAKIHCGETNLGYSLFHDLISWFQSRILFRL
ncbi:MAG: HlyD family efflux transporter periplasmic adaptor subunit [Pirellulales bacterium]